MAEPERHVHRNCWCGNLNLRPFSADFQLCQACGTLVSQAGLDNGSYLVQNDETDFYGKKYWLDHQAKELGLPQIVDRARLDLPERGVYWLRHLLGYRRPPARVLELGAAHGAFVALMRSAGFDATGLELSSWVADCARQTFDVPMLVGPIEQQDLAPGSFDVIVAHDVMEHLPDPIATLRRAVELLTPDGLLFIQMPEYPDGKSFDDLTTAKDRFLDHTKNPEEHLYLYSKRSARMLLSRLGLGHFAFQSPIFDYDMYFVASRRAPERAADSVVETYLQGAPSRRLLLGLFDKAAEVARVREELAQVREDWRVCEEDRAARLVVIQRQAGIIHHQGGQIMELAQWKKQVDHLHKLLTASDANRIALHELLVASDAERTRLHELLAARDDNRVRRRQPMWKRVAKKVAKTLLPAGLHQKLRNTLKH